MSTESLQHLVEEWLRLDKNEVTLREVRDLWYAGNIDELEKRMRSRISFGTAGLRGRMEAGWARMNDLIIIQATQGLCEYVMKNIPQAAVRGVVIGHDHRHNSSRWANLTAAAFLVKGMKVYLLNGVVPTPLVPFSVKKLNASCGVMITGKILNFLRSLGSVVTRSLASHNPKQDNGYKVYWDNAVQIIAPHDEGIAEAIRANLEPLTWSTDEIASSPLCIDPTKEVTDAYFMVLSSLNKTRTLNETTPLRFVNTSMHGVSDTFAKRAFSDFGFRPFIPVPEQQQPDPDFPTVLFPNPEEKGALDLALQTANNAKIPYVLAQDPDSDRFSAAEKSQSGEWSIFTGDQLGSLFASWVLEQYKLAEKPLEKLAMIASTVSSKMLESMAKAEGFKFAECLTGFKYIGNTALNLEKQGYEVPFGYEEAIGFMFGSYIRDKDGIAASVLFAELIAHLRGQGKTAKSYLQELYKKYGYFQTSNSYFICAEPQIIDGIFQRLRNFNPKDPTCNLPSYPTEIASFKITRVVDLTIGYDSDKPPTYRPALPLSSGHMIQFRGEDVRSETRITLTVRTSGTEPKIKYYLEGSGRDATWVAAVLPTVVHDLATEWFEAEKYGIKSPQ